MKSREITIHGAAFQAAHAQRVEAGIAGPETCLCAKLAVNVFEGESQERRPAQKKIQHQVIGRVVQMYADALARERSI